MRNKDRPAKEWASTAESEVLGLERGVPGKIEFACQMTMDATEARRSEFGPLRIDASRSELFVDGNAVEISSRAFDIVRLLVEASGKLVTKEEIMRRVWRGTTVGENSIQVAVSTLRKGLGPHGGLIRTISGRGYRLADTVVKARTNLPAATSRLIGRDGILDHLDKLLDAHRIVTLTGAGGMGKTCLAVETARRQSPNFPDGVWIAELASLANGKAVPHAVASSLGLELPDSMAQAQRIAGLVGSRKLLLVLDNCEHVIDAVADLVFTLVRVNPGLRVLTTSREPLRTEGEAVYRVSPLAIAPEGESDVNTIREYGAVDLFIDRARAIDSTFPLDDASLGAIAAICRRLDGIPLAIEIAAARAATLGVGELARRLEDQFRSLTSGFRTALPRHRTLDATFDWSYDLLTDEERRGLRCLALPVGPFSLQMAAALICGAGESTEALPETMSGLVIKSLVVPEPAMGQMRYRLLETMRAYGLAKLKECGEFDHVARRHAQYCKSILEGAALDWQGTARPHVLDSLTSMDNPAGNTRSAIEWAFSPTGDVALGISLTLAAVPLWMHLSLAMEARHHVEGALAAFQAGLATDPRTEMRLLTAHGIPLISMMTANADARRSFTRALQLAEAADDPEYQLRAVWGLCYASINDGEFLQARDLALRLYDLATQSTDPSAMNSADLLLAGVLKVMGEYDAARRCAEPILNQVDQHLDRPSSGRFIFNRRALALGLVGAVMWHQGYVDQSTRRLEESVEEASTHDHVLSLCNTLGNWVAVHLFFRGNLVEAERYCAMLFDNASRYGLDFWVLWARCFRGALMVRRGDVEPGLLAVRQAFAEMGDNVAHPRYARLHWIFADALVRAGQFEEALRIADSTLELSQRKGQFYIVPELLRLKGEIAGRQGGPDGRTRADALLRAAIDIAKQQGSNSVQLAAAIQLVHVWEGHEQRAEALSLLAEIYARFSEGFGTADPQEARRLLEG